MSRRIFIVLFSFLFIKEALSLSFIPQINFNNEKSVSVINSALADLKNAFYHPSPRVASHHATYSVELDAKEDGGSPQAEGTMSFEVIAYEHVFLTKQESKLTIQNEEQNPNITSTVFTSSESEDGTNYQFSGQARLDGNMSDEFNGIARLTDPNGPGTLSFGSQNVQDLPAATLFPMRYLSLIIEKAEKLKNKNLEILKNTMFDASNDIRDYVNVETIITNADEKTAKSFIVDQSIYKPEKLWLVESSVYSKDKKQEEPLYKVSQIVSNKGILHEMTISYGPMIMKCKLQTLKIYTQQEAESTLSLKAS